MSVIMRLRAEFFRALRRAGWAGALGGALLALALIGGAAAHAALDAAREELDAERLRLGRMQSTSAATRGRPTTAESVSDFYAGFPSVGELPRILTRLHAHADRHGLNLERTDYRSSDESGTPLMRVSLGLPVRGEFGQIYGWLSELLGDMPEVALEALSVRRGDSEAAPVDADVRLAVFVRREP